MSIIKDSLQLSVNNPNSGEGIENIDAKFNSNDMSISFNSRYLTDIASQIENETIGVVITKENLNDYLSFVSKDIGNIVIKDN